MRIIGGRAKGRKLGTPQAGTRPLTERVREALFSSLSALVPGAAVLDLFAGSGSIGLEALSRGAGGVIFVENDRNALAVLERNIEAVGLGGSIVAADATRLAHSQVEAHRPYDLVFVDPPYAMEDAAVQRVLAGIDGLMAPNGSVVVHRRRGDALPQRVGSLSLVWRRRYGDAELWRYEATEEVPA